jgi:alpha-galactosidase
MFDTMKKNIEDGEELHVNMSEEYAGSIINSIVSGKNSEINGNVLNTGLITNLPQNCCVEVPCLINKNGIQPTYIGKIPEQLACYNRTNINVQMLVVEAVMKNEKKLIYQAVMLDPLCSSMLNFDQMDKMVDELFEAHNDRIPYFK